MNAIYIFYKLVLCLKIGVSVKNRLLNLCLGVVKSQRLDCSQKNGIKCWYHNFLVNKFELFTVISPAGETVKIVGNGSLPFSCSLAKHSHYYLQVVYDFIYFDERKYRNFYAFLL